jgi:hypothetical protein
VLPPIVVAMNTSSLAIAAGTATALPAHMLLTLACGAAGLILLLYVGIALPAVWSANPARRRAATAVLRLILDTLTRSRQH